MGACSGRRAACARRNPASCWTAAARSPHRAGSQGARCSALAYDRLEARTAVILRPHLRPSLSSVSPRATARAASATRKHASYNYLPLALLTAARALRKSEHVEGQHDYIYELNCSVATVRRTQGYPYFGITTLVHHTTDIFAPGSIPCL